MRFPCENYIRFLLCGGESRWTLKDVATHIRRLGYPEPDEIYLAQLRRDLEKIRPKPFDLSSVKTRRWLKDIGLWDISYPSDMSDAAVEILWDPELRPAMEVLILSGIQYEQVEPYLAEVRGRKVSKDLVEHYTYYYWNTKLLRQQEWMEFLNEYPDGQQLKVCYVAKPEYSLHHLGLLHATPDVRQMVNEQAMEAYFRSQETRLMPIGEEFARTYKLLSDVLLRAFEQIRGHSELSKLLDQVRSVGMKLKEPRSNLVSGVGDSQIVDGTAFVDLPTPRTPRQIEGGQR